MVKTAEAAGTVAACGFSYRHSPAISAVRQQIGAGALGNPVHFHGRYWCDYSAERTHRSAGATPAISDPVHSPTWAAT